MTHRINKRIGILGGGQLGKMLMEAGSRMNINYSFLEKGDACPALLVNQNHIVGGLYERGKIEELASQSDVLTYEIEHVNVDALIDLHNQGKQVFPKPDVLKIIQDKGLQKQFFENQNVSTLPYKLVEASNLIDEVNNWPNQRLVLKHRKGGYDGKGVNVVSKDDVTRLHQENSDLLQSDTGYVIEKIIENPVELSVIVAIDQLGNMQCYEVSEMVFDDSSNLMDYLVTPSNQSQDIEEKAKELASTVVQGFNSPGLFAVELFLDGDNNLFVNEIAPRPHNSGHHTIESTYCSQYEQLNRILLGFPLGSTSQIISAVTCNIVGSADVNGEYYLDGLEEVLDMKGVYIHMYGKTHTKPNRKLGHFTVIRERKEDCLNTMRAVKNILRIKSA